MSIQIPCRIPFSIGLIVLLFSNTVSSNAQNLIANGSFSNTATNWTFFAPAVDVEAYYTEDSYGGPSNTNVVAEVDAGANLRQTGINVIPGQTYWLSFRRTRRIDNGTPQPTVCTVKVYNGANNYLNQTITSSNTVWDWQCETFQFTPTINTVDIDFGSISPTTLGTIVDDVTITPVQQVINIIGTDCEGGNITLNAPTFSNDDAAYSDYNWTGPNGFMATGASIALNNLQASMAGDYTCTMTFNTCLRVSGTYHLDVVPTVTHQTENICEGQSYNFNGQILTQPGDYNTTLINANGCDDHVFLHLIVNPLPGTAISPSDSVAICYGDTLLLTSLNTLQGCSYRWYNNLNPILNEMGNKLYTYASGYYQAEITSNAGCTISSDLVTVMVHQPPVASIKINETDNPCITDTLHFTAVNEAVTYNWAPGSVFRNTGSIDARNASGIIQNNNTNVVLTVYDEVGCHTSDSVWIHARECCYLFLPDAFTPNGDALNDVFKPSINAAQKIVSFKIYDRWGKMVYTSTGNDLSGWNGNYPNGEKATSGVYMYGIEYTCGDTKTEFKKGDVTLIRR